MSERETAETATMRERDREMLEAELGALSTIVNALAPLSKQQRERVIRHIAEDLGIIDREPEDDA